MAKKITADTKIFDALEINPKACEILMNYGMHRLRAGARRNGRRSG